MPVAYPNADPVAETIRKELGDVAGRLGYNGDLATVKVTRVGPSGRALDVTLDGSAGPVVVDGVRFWQALALPSTLYTLRQEGEGADGAPTAKADSGTTDAAAPRLGHGRGDVGARTPRRAVGARRRRCPAGVGGGAPGGWPAPAATAPGDAVAAAVQMKPKRCSSNTHIRASSVSTTGTGGMGIALGRRTSSTIGHHHQGDARRVGREGGAEVEVDGLLHARRHAAHGAWHAR